MSIIKAKNKKGLIRTLKRVGDDILLVKLEAVYAFPEGMYEIHKELIKKNPKDYDYYKVCSFVKKTKVIKYVKRLNRKKN